MKDNKQELILNSTQNNSECYAIVDVPDEVRSPEDFGVVINSLKVSDAQSSLWCETNINSLHNTKAEAQHKKRLNCNSDGKCIIKINLPFNEVVRLFKEGSQNKPENFNKILSCMVTPSSQDLYSYLTFGIKANNLRRR